jgi:hypothetical protein
VVLRFPSKFLENLILRLKPQLLGGKSIMKEPGLDGRHRDATKPKTGEIQQKRGDTLNKNLPRSIPNFSPNARLDTMRKETGRTSVDGVRRAAQNR